ncbi:MAG: hypothetical protein R3D67_21085 [Hyphomicrobiaceae bacterium]
MCDRLVRSRPRLDVRAGPDSDIDIIVDYDPDSRFSLLDLIAVGRLIEERLGIKADVMTRPGLHLVLKADIEEPGHQGLLMARSPKVALSDILDAHQSASRSGLLHLLLPEFEKARVPAPLGPSARSSRSPRPFATFPTPSSPEIRPCNGRT